MKGRENLNSILISAVCVCIINIRQVLTIIFESVSSDLLSLNVMNEQLNQFIDERDFISSHIDSVFKGLMDYSFKLFDSIF